MKSVGELIWEKPVVPTYTIKKGLYENQTQKICLSLSKLKKKMLKEIPVLAFYFNVKLLSWGFNKNFISSLFKNFFILFQNK